MLNPIEPPWYVTRMPGGVTGTARKGLPMSIIQTLLVMELLEGHILASAYGLKDKNIGGYGAPRSL